MPLKHAEDPIMFSERTPKSKDDTLRVLKEVERDDVAAIIRPHVEATTAPRSAAGIENVFNELDEGDGRRKAVPSGIPYRSTSDVPQGENSEHAAFFQNSQRAHFKDPWAIWTLSDLFARCGPLLTVFVVAQITSTVLLAEALGRIFHQDRGFLTGVLLLCVFVADGVTFVLLRGRLLSGFRRAAGWLALSTIAPGLVFRAVSWWSTIHAVA